MMPYIKRSLFSFMSLCTALYLHAFFSGNHSIAFTNTTLIFALAGAVLMGAYTVRMERAKAAQREA